MRIAVGGRRSWALGAVAACYGLLLLTATSRVPFGWDEVVYISQVARGVPAALFSAPRARGVVLLVSPVAMLTDSVIAIRVYLSVLAAAGLALAFWPWLKIRRGVVVPLAAAFFAVQWLSVFYGSEAMPNLYVAFGAVAATGWFCRADGWRPRLALAVALVFTGLVRPFDAAWVALPLLALAAWRRHVATAGAIVGGLGVGWGEWLIEAYRSYGGPLARLHAAGADNETGAHFSLGAHLRALNGPLLCRPPTPCGGYARLDMLWFAAIPLFAIIGLVRRRRSPHLPAIATAAAVAVTVAASYILLVGYAAPRFLMPAYALAALPVAEGLSGPYPSRRRVPLTALAVAGVVAYATLQARTLVRVVPNEIRTRTADQKIAVQLDRMGVTPPCLLYGHDAVQIAYYAHCASDGVRARWHQGGKPPASVAGALAAGRHVAVTVRGAPTPAPFLDRWQRHDVVPNWHAYLPPPVN